MINKKGFAFIETIITIVVLSASLLLMFTSYSAIISDEETRLYYDDPAYIYYTNYVKRFLEEYADLSAAKDYYFNDTYVVTIGSGFKFLFNQDETEETKRKTYLEKVVSSFKINQMVLVDTDMFNNCFEDTDICKNSVKNLSYNMQKYINSLGDTTYEYVLAIEYSVKLKDIDDSNKDSEREYVSCTPGVDKRCKSYFASVGISEKTGRETLFVMLEQTKNSGDYVIVSQNGWPVDNYIFNSTLSYCENDSTVSWDEKNKIIVRSGNESNNCYAYFDAYNLGKINTLNITANYNSIKMVTQASKGTSDIAKYYFSIDNGATYKESTSSTYTFSNLSEKKTYNIKAYLVDSLGRKSDIYVTTATTDAYVLPTVDNVFAASTLDSITLHVDATKGTENITTYYYSKDNGVSFISSSESVFVFSGLYNGASYKIKVYVKDSNGRTSAVYSKTASTASYVYPKIKYVSTTSYYNQIMVNVETTTGTNGIAKYFYSISPTSSTSVYSASNNYIFSNLSSGTIYTIVVYAIDTAGKWSDPYKITVMTTKNLLSTYIKSKYTSQGENGLYHHDGTLTNGINDGSYRYSGANPNNYICLSSETTCSDAYLFRIIGVFGDSIKIIKANSVGNMVWSNDAMGWSSSDMIYYLNDTYLSSMDYGIRDYIEMSTWYVGPGANYNLPASEYTSELQQTATSQIGLMSLSDYGFAATNNAWSSHLYDYDSSSIKSNNWMYLGSSEWTINYTGNIMTANYIDSSGYPKSNANTNSYATRPVFYITDVCYESGTGTLSNPYMIN